MASRAWWMGERQGFCRASAGSNQTSFLCCSLLSSPEALQLRFGHWTPGWKWSSSGHSGLSEPSLSLSAPLGQRLGSYTGLWISLFLCLFSLQIFSHTKGTKWNASPVSQRTLLAPLPPYGLPLSGWVSFISSQYPKEPMVIKTINAAFLSLFLLVDNYDNWIQTQLHRRFPSLRWPQNVISISAWKTILFFPERSRWQLIRSW